MTELEMLEMFVAELNHIPMMVWPGKILFRPIPGYFDTVTFLVSRINDRLFEADSIYTLWTTNTIEELVIVMIKGDGRATPKEGDNE